MNINTMHIYSSKLFLSFFFSFILEFEFPTWTQLNRKPKRDSTFIFWRDRKTKKHSHAPSGQFHCVHAAKKTVHSYAAQNRHRHNIIYWFWLKRKEKKKKPYFYGIGKRRRKERTWACLVKYRPSRTFPSFFFFFCFFFLPVEPKMDWLEKAVDIFFLLFI